MLSAFSEKSVYGLLGTGVTNGATVTARIDRLGFDHLSLDLVMGTADVVSNSPSVLKFTEGDTTVLTNASAVTELTGGTATGNFTIPAADTANPNAYRFNIDLRGRKRYLFLSVSPRTTQQTIFAGRLRRAKETPAATGATTGLGVHLQVGF
jgi:hypothetical protein